MNECDIETLEQAIDLLQRIESTDGYYVPFASLTDEDKVKLQAIIDEQKRADVVASWTASSAFIQEHGTITSQTIEQKHTDQCILLLFKYIMQEEETAKYLKKNKGLQYRLDGVFSIFKKIDPEIDFEDGRLWAMYYDVIEGCLDRQNLPSKATNVIKRNNCSQVDWEGLETMFLEDFTKSSEFVYFKKALCKYLKQHNDDKMFARIALFIYDSKYSMYGKGERKKFYPCYEYFCRCINRQPNKSYNKPSRLDYKALLIDFYMLRPDDNKVRLRLAQGEAKKRPSRKK